MKNPRQIAAQALCKVQRSRAWSNLVLDNLLEQNNLDSRDSAFASALFYGVLERMLTLDACIAAHCSVKLRKLSPEVHAALRLGMYQLLYMDSVPDSAAVAQSVELVRKLRQPKSAGLVNAVLRAFLRAEKRIPLPQSGPVEERLAVEYSCPTPLVKLFLDAYGEDTTKALLLGSLGRPPLNIRVNTLKTTTQELRVMLEEAGVTVQLDELLPHCLTLESAGAVHRLSAFREGLFHVQDKASQLCALAVEARPGMRVLDSCAAPGGKSFTMAQMMENQGELVAADLHPHRVELITKRAAEMGLSSISAQAADMALPQPDLGEFHRVLCDVPCSGLGVIRRKPEIKYKPLEEFAEYPSIQYKILENSANYCTEGGLLIYSTCTLNPAENLPVVERFLEAHPAFCPHPLPEQLGGGWHKTFLNERDADGFFVACLQRSAQ